MYAIGGVLGGQRAAMRQRRAELTALLLAAQIVSLCLLVAEADALVRNCREHSLVFRNTALLCASCCP